MKFNNVQKRFYTNVIKTANHYNSIGLFSDIDQHIHTTFSDGLFSLEQIIFIAKQINLKRIIITDHNSCLPGFKALQDLKLTEELGVQVDIGCEIAVRIKDYKTNKYIPIEILSYFADPYKIQTFLDMHKLAISSQYQQLELLKDISMNLGLKVSDEILLQPNQYATEALCKDLISYPENKGYFIEKAPQVLNEPKLFFKKLSANPSSDFYIDTTENLPDCKEAVDTIIQAGGIAFIAHPFIYIYQNNKEVKQMLDNIIEDIKISGVEVYHSAHTVNQIEGLENYATEKGLNISGGSDFHCGPDTILGYGKKGSPIEFKQAYFDWL